MPKTNYWRASLATGGQWLLAALLTLTLLLGIAGFIGYHLANQQLQQWGISQWQLSFAQLSFDHIIIDELSVTYKEPARTTASSNPPPTTLQELLATSLPDYAPKRLTINALNINLVQADTNVSGRVVYSDSKLTLELLRPYASKITLNRQLPAIDIKATATNQRFNANYNIDNGELVARAQLNVPQEQANKPLPTSVRLTQPLATRISWQGKLPAAQTELSLASVIEQLSGTLTLTSTAPIAMHLQTPTAELDLTGMLDATVDVAHGQLNHYQLTTTGDAGPLPWQLGTATWQLQSAESLTLPLQPSLLNRQTIAQAAPFPITGTIQLNDAITINQRTKLSLSGVHSSIALQEFNWRDSPELQQLLATHLSDWVIQQGRISANAALRYDWNSTAWQVDDAVIRLTEMDSVYQTLALQQANLTLPISVADEKISVNGASIDVEEINQGFKFGPISAEFDANVPLKSPSESYINLHKHSISALNGSISIPNQRYSLHNEFALPIVFEKLSLGQLMQQYPTDKITIDGEISGTLPLVWNSETLTVNRGYLSALEPGGQLTVHPSLLASSVGNNPNLKTMVNALEDFHYQHLSSVVDYSKEGTLRLELSLNGYSPAVENGREINLNINLEEDLPALIKGLQLSNSLNDVIQQRVQDSLKN